MIGNYETQGTIKAKSPNHTDLETDQDRPFILEERPKRASRVVLEAERGAPPHPPPRPLPTENALVGPT